MAIFPQTLHAAEAAIMRTVVNQQIQGDLLVRIGDDGTVSFRENDIPLLGIARSAFSSSQIVDGESYVRLRQEAGIESRLIVQTASLELFVPQDLLTNRQSVTVPAQYQPRVYTPRDTSAFFNYGFTRTEGDLAGNGQVTFSQEFGARWADYLLLSDAVYLDSGAQESWTRLMTSLTRDDRSSLRRVVVGDQFTHSLSLGSGLTMGGLGISKVYSINPYFYPHPLNVVSGAVSLPSEVDIYMNGSRIRSQRLAPGSFELKDLAGHAGTNTVEIVLRDPFGRETRIEQAFYMSDRLLARGLHEYGYYAGALRNNFGYESNEYGPLVLSAFHRYGLTEVLTAGLMAEAGNNVTTGGAELSFVPRYGVVTAAISLSDHEDAFGAASLLSYYYLRPDISPHASVRTFSREYATVGTADVQQVVKREANVGVTFQAGRIGAFSADVMLTEYHDDTHDRRTSVSYVKSLSSRSMLHASIVRRRGMADVADIFAGLTYNFDRGISGSARYSKTGEVVREGIQVQKIAPPGEGYGYRVTADRSEEQGQATTTVSPFAQYNSGFGMYSVDYRAVNAPQQDSQSMYTASASGAVVFAARNVGFTRPVRDSFALVKVGEVEGVRVYSNNQEMGRTGKDGLLFVPSLVAYQRNHILLADSDIPLDVTFDKTRRLVSPPLRSGSCVEFNVSMQKPIAGTLIMRTADGEMHPLENVRVDLMSGAGNASFTTGFGGEFYVERYASRRLADESTGWTECDFRTMAKDSTAVSYRAVIEQNGSECEFDILVPVSSDLIIDLGEVQACTIGPGGSAVPPAGGRK